MESGKWFKRGILLVDARDALFKCLCILWSPPVAQIAFRIELAPLIVEAVRKFMSDHDCDASKVNGVVDCFVEERWLQNSRGEIDVVECGTVVRIHRGWSHAEFRAIKRLADLRKLAVLFKCVSSLHVAEQISAHDIQLRIIAPLAGIANLVADGREFQKSLLLGVGSHPVKAL